MAKEKADEKERQAEAERQQRLQQAKQEYDAEIAKRRHYCHCRAVVMSQLGVAQEAPLISIKAANAVMESRLLKEDLSIAAETTMIDWLKPALTEALANLYSLCGAAAYFPVYVVYPNDLALTEVFSVVSRLHQEISEELGIFLRRKQHVVKVLALPQRGNIADTLVNIFDVPENTPGAVVLAFDSPLFQAASSGMTSGCIEKNGKPSEAVIALLLTHPELNKHVASLPECHDSFQEDYLKPYWEKERQSKHTSPLYPCAMELRRQLADLPTLGRIHLAAGQKGIPEITLKATETYLNLLESAMINAGLLEPPFSSFKKEESTSEEKAKDSPQAPEPAWLVHNAGGSEFTSKRLPVLGAALFQRKLPLDPIDHGTNFVTSVGNLGNANQVGQMALTIAQTAAHHAPVLWADFADELDVTMAFILPADEPQT